MMTAEQLLGSIFERALQGKLVEQRVSEGTGEDLFQKIQAEKQRLIKSGGLKKSKPVEPITEDEIPFDIPETWKWVRVESIVTLNPKNELADDIETAFIPMTLVDDGYSNRHTFEVRKWGEIKKGFSHFADGDIGVAKITPCFQNRKSVIFKNLINGFGAGTTELTIVRPFTDSCCPEYLLAAFKSESFIKKGMKSFTGTAGQQRIHKDFLRTYVMPLPPLEEQKRIVAKIEELMPFVEQYAKASTRLNTLNASFPEQIKKSILQQAVMGKLVPQDPNDEPASVLLKKIAEEKQKLIKEGKIKKEKNTSFIFRDGQSWYEVIGGEKTCIDEEVPFDIPENWSWVRLNELGDYKKGPFGSALTKSMFVPAGHDSVKVYEQKNAIQKDWTLGEYFIKREYYDDKMTGFTVEAGDVIVSCAGTIGETYVMPKDIELGIINQALMRMKIYAPMNVAYFLMYFDYVIKESAREQSKGSAIKNIPPFAIFKRLLFPIPPLAEQDRILKKLKRMDAQISRLKSK